jgi:FkbM family methyltransferase
MWDWSKLKGDPACLKWSRRDLESLEATLRVVKGRTAVVQAGGNVGIFPKRLAEEFDTVYTFEPSPVLFAAMMQNAPEANIIRFQAALGHERTLVSLSRNRRDGSGKPEHDGLTHVVGQGAIPTLLIDDLGLSVCDLIYLDVEGFELYALLGAKETIRRCKPVIAVEVNRGIEYYGHSADTLRKLICGCGYRNVLKMHSDEVYAPI